MVGFGGVVVGFGGLVVVCGGLVVVTVTGTVTVTTGQVVVGTGAGVVVVVGGVTGIPFLPLKSAFAQLYTLQVVVEGSWNSSIFLQLNLRNG